MEIQNDGIYLAWKYSYRDKRINEVLRCLYDCEYLIDDYFRFIEAFGELKLNNLEFYLFNKYGESFIYNFYLLYLEDYDVQYFRTKQNLQTTEKTRVSSKKERSDDSEENETTRRKKRKIS